MYGPGGLAGSCRFSFSVCLIGLFLLSATAILVHFQLNPSAQQIFVPRCKHDAGAVTTKLVSAFLPLQNATQRIYSSDGHRYDSVSDLNMDGLAPFTVEAQQAMHKWQFRSEQECKVAKYYQGGGLAGLGSQWHVQAAILAFAIDNDMIYIYPERQTYMTGVVNCDPPSWLCLHLPISNCSEYATPENTLMFDNAELHEISRVGLPKLFRKMLKEAGVIGLSEGAMTLWWNAQASAFATRMNPLGLEIIKAMRMGTGEWAAMHRYVFMLSIVRFVLVLQHRSSLNHTGFAAPILILISVR